MIFEILFAAAGFVAGNKKAQKFVNNGISNMAKTVIDLLNKKEGGNNETTPDSTEKQESNSARNTTERKYSSDKLVESTV